MSINVTVNGKPISFTRTGGRMVACEQDSEFNRRRKIRLQQVRQQSKEIAAEVRNRVKQEKTKQLSNFELQTEKDVRKIHERKLQTLQKQYDECNREIGAAHKNAALEKDPLEVFNEISKKNDKSAHDRLKSAVEKKAKEELQRKNKVELLEKQRQYSKEIEKTRANLVVAINKQHTPPKVNRSSKKRKKKSETNLNDTFNSDIENISSPSPTFNRLRRRSPMKPDKENVKQKPENPKQKKIIFDQEVHQVVCEKPCNPQQDEYQSESEKSEKYSIIDIKSPRKESEEKPQKDDKCSACLEKSKSKLETRPTIDLICDNETCPYYSPTPSPPPTPTKYASHFSSSTSVANELPKEEVKKLIEEHRPIDGCRSMDFYKSTKIADRIRQRSDQLLQDIDLVSLNMPPEHKRKTTNIHEAKKLQMKHIPIVDIPSVNKAQLPYVPQTSLKSKLTISQMSPQQQTTRAKYYDHSQHFTKTYVPPAFVQKLDKSCVDVDPSIEAKENANFKKHMQSQDERAKIRGAKALKRAQVQNDYKQLMEELPALQRQERLAAMRQHNPEFHMTDERLNELERRRQNRIEDIFEKYYHKSKVLETPVITIRPIQKPTPDEALKLPFTALDVSEDLQAFNIGQWKSETSKSQYTNRKTGSSSSGNKFQFVDSKPELTSDEVMDEDSRQRCLAELLQRLNKQRELLLQEVQNLPPSSNLQKILQDEVHVTDDSNNTEPKPKFVSATTSPISLEPKKTKDTKKRHGATTSTDSAEEKQKKRQKHKEKKLKVQKNDEGTQTSPIITKKASPKKEKPVSKSKKSVVQEHEPPTKLNAADDDKLCEIIIKMSDESKVKICTQPIGSVSAVDKKVQPAQINCDISSSTSYLSPPVLCPQSIESNDQQEKYRTQYKDILYGKPKQTNLDTFAKRDDRTDHIKKHTISKQKHVKAHTPTKIINPQLLNYIKKLLSMSRKSIDDLTVSTISDVSSPSPHIIESDHNNPFLQLQNVMNYYNLSFADIQNELSKSSISSATDKVTSSATNKNVSNTNAEMEQLEGDNSSPTSDDVDYSEILSKYQEVTRSCVNKISTLTLMIDKIRAEKEHILSPISVDLNENSITSYLELPPRPKSQNCTSTSGDSNKSSSLTQEEIDRYFLEIGPPKKGCDQIDADKNKNQGDAFVPMLKGIPKYSNDPIVNQINLIPKPRPPASLAQNMQRYNLNTDMIPHELSTIIELDTVTTSRNMSELRAKSPPIRDSGPNSPSPSNSGFITISPERSLSGKKDRRKSPRSKNTIAQSSLSENTSSSSPENFENMLRTMGLAWAIPTLKKTQEALALSSSSSSDSSLRKYELQDISEIAGGTQNKDRSAQRTSTPVHQSKSTDSKNNLFASVSDISSVRQHSDENMFLSIPDISLDTNRSLK